MAEPSPAITETTLARIKGLLVREDGPDLVILLGAGASVKSGVPPAAQIAQLALRRAFCREHGFSDDDPTVVRSDWTGWAIGFDWFSRDRPLVDLYPPIIERLLQPREERRDFFLKLLSLRREPSAGYRALADLVFNGWVHTVLTTNFDELAYEACRAKPTPWIQIVRTPSEAGLISTAPAYPQVIHLHGSVEHYTDQNLESETQTLDPMLRPQILPLLRDHPVLVIGYRGSETSIMHDLFRDAAPEGKYRRGVFWCVRNPTDLHRNVVELAALLGSNFQLVRIDGFDECLSFLNHEVDAHPRRRTATVSSRPPVHDLEPATGRRVDDIDLPLAEQELGVYERSLGTVTGTTADVGRARTLSRMRECWLLLEADSQPSRAGVLLFGLKSETSIRIVSSDGETTLAGNIVRLAQSAQDALAEYNEPFRLKGPASEEVRLYPPLALKELVVNALVHRDHSVENPILIEIAEDRIRIVSPGGLVSGLDPARLGNPGVKAYRNPVLADVLYGIGLMDKAGSGLSDVKVWAREGGGDASFETTDDNARFVATIVARPERPDPVTGTAAPRADLQVFTSNVLQIRFLKDRVWSALTSIRARSEVYQAHPGIAIAPFAHSAGRLYTFSELRDLANPLKDHLLSDAETVGIGSFQEDEDRERILVQLLNSELLFHARSCGLLSLAFDRRLYFPRTEDGPREISYQARVRRASRTVTKPVLSRVTNHISYWEHQAVRFSFRRFGGEWGLTLVPSWVFTRDGLKDVLTGPRVTRLATRRSARDYNPQVAGDMTFWAWVLAHGNDHCILEDGGGEAIEMSGRFVELATTDFPAAEGPILSFEADLDEADLEEELGRIAVEESGPGLPAQ